MKGLGIKKKKWVALALAAAVTVAGMGAMHSSAAGKIDESKQCTLTVTVPQDATNTNPFSKYKGFVTVRLYKVADVNASGQYENEIDGVNLSTLSGSKVTAKDTETVAKAAYDAFKLDSESPKNPTASVIFDLSDISTAISNVDRGLYLFVPQPTYDDIYEYSFKYSLVSVPTSNYITATKVDEKGNTVADTSDTWNYNVDVLLKAEAKPRLGRLIIEKNLKTFDKSLGTASFVYKVIATRDGKTVFNNVYVMNFDEAKTDTLTIENIPAGAMATVEEVYTGASYSVENAKIENIKIEADNTKDENSKTKEPAKASFTNDYNEKLEVGGIAVENHFTKNNDENQAGNYTWDGSNLTKKSNQEGAGE